MNAKHILTVGLVALSTTLMAWPSKEETDKVSSVVTELMRPEIEAIKEGRKSRSAVAVDAIELAQKADSEASKLLLLKGAFKLYAGDGAFEKAVATLKDLQTEVSDVPVEYIVV